MWSWLLTKEPLLLKAMENMQLLSSSWRKIYVKVEELEFYLKSMQSHGSQQQRELMDHLPPLVVDLNVTCEHLNMDSSRLEAFLPLSGLYMVVIKEVEIGGVVR